MGSIINWNEQKIQELNNILKPEKREDLTEGEKRFLSKMESSEEVNIINKTNFNRVSLKTP